MRWIQRWTLWQAPPGVVAAVCLTVAVAGATFLGLVASMPTLESGDWTLLVVLAVVGDLSGRATERIGRAFQGRSTSGAATIALSTDSVWIVAAIVTLPGHLVALLAVLLSITADVRWRRSRPADSPFPLHRLVFNAAMMLTAATGGALAYRAVGTALTGRGADGMPAGGLLLSCLAAILVIYTVQMLTTGMIAVACGASARSLPGLLLSSVPDELGLASLGLLLAVAWRSDPWLLVAGIFVALHLQQSLLHRQLREAVEHDAKTGLLSADTWREKAERELSVARSRHGELGVLLLDLDHFKDVNDTHGHLMGDDLLAAVAQAMQDSVREADLVGRFGGEEFIVLLPAADATVTGALAERLRVAVSEVRVLLPGGGPPLRVTASVGAAMFPTDGTTLDDLLRSADRALYSAKRTGRDRVALSVPVAVD